MITVLLSDWITIRKKTWNLSKHIIYPVHIFIVFVYIQKLNNIIKFPSIIDMGWHINIDEGLVKEWNLEGMNKQIIFVWKSVMDRQLF